MIRARRTYEHKSPIIVDEEEIRFFDKFLTNEFDKVQYSAQCVDNTVIEFDSAHGLLQYENPSFKQISGIKMRAIKGEIILEQEELEIQLGNNSRYTNETASFTFSYNDLGWGMRVEKELIDRIKSLSPGNLYSIITRTPFTFVPFAVIIILFVVAAFAITVLALSGNSRTETSTNTSSGTTTAIAMTTVITLTAIGWLIDKSKEYLFPRIFFVLGKQKGEYDKRRQYRNFVFVGVIFAFVLGVAVNWFSVLLFN